MAQPVSSPDTSLARSESWHLSLKRPRDKTIRRIAFSCMNGSDATPFCLTSHSPLFCLRCLRRLGISPFLNSCLGTAPWHTTVHMSVLMQAIQRLCIIQPNSDVGAVPCHASVGERTTVQPSQCHRLAVPTYPTCPYCQHDLTTATEHEREHRAKNMKCANIQLHT